MEIIRESLSLKELKKRMDENYFIKGTVPVDLSDVIDSDLESFLDLISEKLIGRAVLMEVNYSVVGHEKDTLLLEVSGYVPDYIIDEDDEE